MSLTSLVMVEDVRVHELLLAWDTEEGLLALLLVFWLESEVTNDLAPPEQTALLPLLLELVAD